MDKDALTPKYNPDEPRMDGDLFRRVSLYHATMATLRKLLKASTITQQEYALADDKIAAKYGLSTSVIFR